MRWDCEELSSSRSSRSVSQRLPSGITAGAKVSALCRSRTIRGERPGRIPPTALPAENHTVRPFDASPPTLMRWRLAVKWPSAVIRPMRRVEPLNHIGGRDPRRSRRTSVSFTGRGKLPSIRRPRCGQRVTFLPDPSPTPYRDPEVVGARPDGTVWHAEWTGRGSLARRAPNDKPAARSRASTTRGRARSSTNSTELVARGSPRPPAVSHLRLHRRLSRGGAPAPGSPVDSALAADVALSAERTKHELRAECRRVLDRGPLAGELATAEGEL
jgi:hypothetical protein